MDVVSGESRYVLSVTENGIGRRTEVCEYNKQKRGRRGHINYKVTQKTGDVAGMCIMHPDDEIFLFSEKGYVLCVDADELRKLHRAAGA